MTVKIVVVMSVVTKTAMGSAHMGISNAIQCLRQPDVSACAKASFQTCYKQGMLPAAKGLFSNSDGACCGGVIATTGVVLNADSTGVKCSR